MSKPWMLLASVSLTLCLPTAVFAAGPGDAPSERAPLHAPATANEDPYAAVNDAVDRVNAVLADQGIADQVALSVTYGPDALVAYTTLAPQSSALQAAVAASAPVPLSMQTTVYSVEELVNEGARISLLPDVAWAGPTDDYSGVQVSMRSEASSIARSSVESRFPLVMVQPSSPSEIGRNNDVMPVWGGALIANTNDATACSVGIGVTVRGARGFTTAEHCPSGTYMGWDLGASVGTAHPNGPKSTGKDIRFVKARASSARMWTGAWDGTTSTRVRGVSAPANNQRICTGGGITGETCADTFIRGTGLSSDGVGPGFWILSETIDDNVQRCIVNKGDSGGPAYTYSSDGSVRIRGFLVQSDPQFSTTNCPNMNPNFLKNVFTSGRAFAVNAPDALRAIGATPTR